MCLTEEGRWVGGQTEEKGESEPSTSIHLSLLWMSRDQLPATWTCPLRGTATSNCESRSALPYRSCFLSGIWSQQ